MSGTTSPLGSSPYGVYAVAPAAGGTITPQPASAPSTSAAFQRLDTAMGGPKLSGLAAAAQALKSAMTLPSYATGIASGATAPSDGAGLRGHVGSVLGGGPGGTLGGTPGSGVGGGDLNNAYACGGTVHGVVQSFGGSHFLRKLARGSGLARAVPMGRADKFVASVPHGGAVIPSDVVSRIGQGDVITGGRTIAAGIKGLAKPNLGAGLAGGGRVGKAPMVAIHLSPGDFYVHPKHVAAFGNGDPAAGQRDLDRLVTTIRQAAR